MAARILEFFEAVPGCLANHLNAQELFRIIVAALSTGGGVFAVLQGILVAVGVVFPAPSDAAFAAVVLTTILEAHRRLGHGQPLSSRPRQSPLDGR
jgi:hypothetical protein